MGACFQVYNEMGSGLLEPVYQECLKIEFQIQKIPYRSQPELDIHYRERKLNLKYIPDFICYDKIIVEIKALTGLVEKHRAQVINYLHLTKHKLGLLINFGQYPKLVSERIANTKKLKE